MLLATAPTELTSGATDALLAIESLVIMGVLWSSTTAVSWKRRLWCGIFGLLMLAAALGAVVHGLEMTETIRTVLWKPLYLILGLLVALFVVGAVADWRGLQPAKKLLPWSFAVGFAFFGVIEWGGGSFLIFTLYEATAMLAALLIYSLLAAKRHFRGTALIALAILLNLVAAGIQASDVSLQVFVPFDHNGVFHLVQILATAILGTGLYWNWSIPDSVQH